MSSLKEIKEFENKLINDIKISMYNKIEDEKITVADNMVKFGGSFVRSLGEALYHADPINTRKIKDTFSEYWEQFLNFKKKK